MTTSPRKRSLLGKVLRRNELWSEMDEEMRQHVELEAEELVRQGVPPAEARQQARLAFGAPDAWREEAWGARVPRWLEESARDLRYAIRSLRRSPTFTTMAVLCVALGIGVTTTIFGVVNGLLLRPLPFPHPDRLVVLYATQPAQDTHGVNISRPDFDDWQRANHTFQDMGMFSWSTMTFTGTGAEPERVEAADVTANLFSVLGVEPALGRGFAKGEDAIGAPRVVLISWGLWQRRFAGDRGVLGRSVMVDGQPATVIGVMPPRFAFPERGLAWQPLRRDPVNDLPSNRFYAGAIGRLRPGVTIEAAQSDIKRVSLDLQRARPADNLGWEAEVIPLREDIVGKLRRPLLVFLAAVGAVLLVACANVANLSLVRAAGRARELALRASLGAGRGRVMRQLLAESLVIAAAGALLGGAFTVIGLRLAGRAFPDDVPFYFSLVVDRNVLVFVTLLTVATAALFGLLPAWRAGHQRLSPALRDGTAGSGEGREKNRARSTLVIAEIALSLVLMTGAGLLVRSYLALMSTDLGFDRDGIVSFRVTLPQTTYGEKPKRVIFFDQLFARLRGLPGVEVVGSGQGTPFSGWNVEGGISIDGLPLQPGEERIAHYQIVTPQFFRAMGVPLLRGRPFGDADRDPAAPNVLVNESFARRFLNGRDPLGYRVKVGEPDGEDPWAPIVGVVADYRHYRLPQPMQPAVYFPYGAWPSSTQTVVLRSRLADPLSLVPAVRQAVRELDADVPIYRVETFEQAIARTLWRQRLQGQALAAFAVLALLLAAVGLYGVVSYSVAQRRREIGVRVALGATRAQVVGVVLGQGAALVMRGIVVGLVAALLLSRPLAALLYEVRATDPLTYAVVPVVLGLVALLATAVPALLAARLAPQAALRAE
ncbi:MAG TPA: ABC transporter permease [Thermoanaerobaculia bacterium]|jgi:putative ABC transport system permease protein|nr:ABC transporter permease [Thermoanaerobaculia bacterium]